MSSKKLKSMSCEDLKDNPAFPRIVNSSRHMISCENFSLLRSNERICTIIRWSQPRRVRVVFAIREPSRWLWSQFQQVSRNQIDPTIDWNAFLEDSLSRNELLPSYMLKPWLKLDPVPEIEIINQLQFPVFRTPEIIAGALGVQLDPVAISNSASKKFNESLGLGETMLMPHFNSEVAKELNLRQAFWGKIPVSFVKNCLLYQSSTAKVLFELGRELENGRLSKMDSLLGRNSAVQLQKFSGRWWKNLFRTLDGLQHRMHGGSLQDLVERQPVFEGYNLPIGTGFPISGYENYLELPRDYFSLARLYASNIGLLWRTINSQKEVSWLNS